MTISLSVALLFTFGVTLRWLWYLVLLFTLSPLSLSLPIHVAFFHAEMNMFGLPFKVHQFFSYIVYLHYFIFKHFSNLFFISAHTFLILVFPQFINSVLSKLFILFFCHHLSPLFHFSPSSNHHTVVLSKNSFSLLFFFAQSFQPYPPPHTHTQSYLPALYGWVCFCLACFKALWQ